MRLPQGRPEAIHPACRTRRSHSCPVARGATVPPAAACWARVVARAVARLPSRQAPGSLPRAPGARGQPPSRREGPCGSPPRPQHRAACFHASWGGLWRGRGGERGGVTAAAQGNGTGTPDAGASAPAPRGPRLREPARAAGSRAARGDGGVPSTPPRPAAWRDAALRRLDRPLRIGYIRASRVSAARASGRPGLGRPGRGKQPERFVYAQVRPQHKWNWNPTPDLYPRYGDVKPLLEAVDDLLVIMGSGTSCSDGSRLGVSQRLRQGGNAIFCCL